MTRWQKATALVPLALLSGAWTASLAATGSSAAAAAAGTGQQTLPDGTSVPTDAIKAPASVSLPDAIAPGVPAGSTNAIVANATTTGIPSAALAAYQRAAEVINAADKSCHIPWQLIAAIGRVESDHGRYGGNVLGNDGVSKPGIYGIPLDGSNGTAKVADTDAGQFDNDSVYDRAVGPMQFIPSTWSVVGVDADGDGKRNPQDINDASLATAVYLCSGDEDLSQTSGQRSAVYRYNHSQRYVDLVLSIMRAYMGGDFSSVPNSTASGYTFYPAPAEAVVTGATAGQRPGRAHAGHQVSGAHHSGGGSGASSGGGNAGGGGGGGSTSPSAPSAPSTSDPGQAVKDTVKSTTDQAKDTVKNTTKDTTKVVASAAELTNICTSALQAKYGSAPQAAVDKCVTQLTGKTKTQAQNAVGNVVANLGDLVQGILGGGTGGVLN